MICDLLSTSLAVAMFGDDLLQARKISTYVFVYNNNSDRMEFSHEGGERGGRKRQREKSSMPR